MTRALDSRALQYACNRIEDFALVHRGRPLDEKEDAVNIWLEGIGLDESLKLEFAEWVVKFCGPDTDTGPLFLGLTLGLLINQWNHDNPYTPT